MVKNFYGTILNSPGLPDQFYNLIYNLVLKYDEGPEVSSFLERNEVHQIIFEQICQSAQSLAPLNCLVAVLELDNHQIWRYFNDSNKFILICDLIEK